MLMAMDWTMFTFAAHGINQNKFTFSSPTEILSPLKIPMLPNSLILKTLPFIFLTLMATVTWICTSVRAVISLPLGNEKTKTVYFSTTGKVILNCNLPLCLQMT